MAAQEKPTSPPQLFDPLAVMVGEFARDFVDGVERVAAIDRLYTILNEARRWEREAAAATVETRNGPDPVPARPARERMAKNIAALRRDEDRDRYLREHFRLDCAAIEREAAAATPSLDATDMEALNELERDLAAGEVEHMGDVWQRLRAVLDAPEQRALAARLSASSEPSKGEPR